MSILKFVFNESNSTVKPVGTKVTLSSGRTYVKESSGWFNSETGAKLNYKSSLILESDRHTVRFEEKPDGYYMNGMKMTPEQAAPFVDYERYGGDWYNKSNGSAIYSEDNRKLEQQALKVLKELYKEHDAKEDKGSSEDTSSTEQENDTNQSEPKQEEPESKDSEEKTTSDTESTPSPEQPNDKSEADTESTSNIPNGYVYTSGKGNKFMYKNGTWFNLVNKKPVNPSNVNMLNRSAEKAINDFNAKSDIKIGDKVKSGKGVEYTYNGTGFTSPDGKQLTGGAAQSALNKLKTEKSASTQDSTDNSSTNANTAEPKSDETIVPGQSAVDTNPPEQQGSSSTSQGSSEQGQNSDPNDYTAQSIINNLGDNGTENTDSTSGAESDSSTTSAPPSAQPSSTQPKDPMTDLAQKIKSSKYNKQIVTLLSRGGDMDLLAADILLNGNVQEVINQLKSLNNSNTQ